MAFKFILALIVLVAFCLTAIGQEQTTSYWLNKGDEFYGKGSFDVADICYNKVLELDPKNISALYRKGAVLSYLHRFNESSIVFNKALTQAPENPHIWIAKGLALYVNAEFNDSLENQILDLNTENLAITDKNISFKKVEGSVKNKKVWENYFNVSSGIKFIAAQLNKESDKDSNLLFLFEDPFGNPADASLGTGSLGPIEVNKPTQGLWKLKVYGYEVPRETGASFKINFITKPYMPEKYDDVLKAFDKAIELDPLSPIAMNLKAMALYESGEFDKAIETTNMSLKIDPSNAETWHLKGLVLTKQSNFKEALKCLNVATDLSPLFPDAWHDKGIVLQYLGKTDEANIALNTSTALGYTSGMVVPSAATL